MSWIGLLLAFFFLGLCIFVHELGHFLAAKWRGLHIIAFSIGFKKIWGFKHKGIDYRIGCIPCGGYVDLPQIDATGEAKDEHGNPLPPAKPIDRIITAFAGPLFNVLFGILLSMVVWWIGVPQDSPKMRSIVVDQVDANSPEEKAGLQSGDIISAINGKKFNCSWGDFVRTIIFTTGDVTLDIRRGNKKIKIKYRPAPNTKRTPREAIAYPFFSPLIPLECAVFPDSPVEQSGMKSGDIILEMNGEKLIDYNDLGQALARTRGEPINFMVRREGRILEIKDVKPQRKETGIYQLGIGLGESLHAVVTEVETHEKTQFKVGDLLLRAGEYYISSLATVNNAIAENEGQPLTFLVKRGGEILKITENFPVDTKNFFDGKIGKLDVLYRYTRPSWFARFITGFSTPQSLLSTAGWISISSVSSGSAADKAGFQKFDKLMKIDGEDIIDVGPFVNKIRKSKGKPVTIEIERDGKQIVKKLTAEKLIINNIGLEMILVEHPSPWQQFSKVISMTFHSLKGIMSQESTLSGKHLSGPIGIVRGIGVTWKSRGIMPVLALIVLITYSLALLNIMPLPVLDGGHIVLAVIEQIRKKPMPSRIIQPVFIVFVFFLLSMMLYVTFYDTLRMMSITKEYRYLPNVQPVKADLPNG